MPAAACPGTVHKYGYTPFFLNVTTSLAVRPGWISGVFLPLISKSCRTWPMLLKTNVTVPGFPSDLLERRKKNSPPLTWTAVVPLALDGSARPLDGDPRPGGGEACVFDPPAGALSE